MVIRSNWFTSMLGILGIAIFPFIIIKRGSSREDKLINHERIHIRQELEMLVIPFYLLYFYYSIRRGYRNNPFEIEAYDNEDNLDYLKSRKLYSWTKHI